MFAVTAAQMHTNLFTILETEWITTASTVLFLSGYSNIYMSEYPESGTNRRLPPKTNPAVDHFWLWIAKNFSFKSLNMNAAWITVSAGISEF